MLYEILVFYL